MNRCDYITDGWPHKQCDKTERLVEVRDVGNFCVTHLRRLGHTCSCPYKGRVHQHYRWCPLRSGR